MFTGLDPRPLKPKTAADFNPFTSDQAQLVLLISFTYSYTIIQFP